MSEESEREDQQEGSRADEYVNEQLIEAEIALEEALIASEDSKQRGAILSNYRAVVTTLMRYYDE